MEALAERLHLTIDLTASPFQTDEAAAASVGIELNDSNREALRSEDWAQGIGAARRCYERRARERLLR